MLSFATELPMRHEISIQEFVSAIRVWILGSPHTGLSQDELADFTGDRKWSFEKNDERIEVLILKSPDEEAAGIRYNSKDKRGILWTTSIVFHKNKSDAWARVEVSRQSKGTVPNLPPAKKPIVVKTLMSDIGGSTDGMLRVRSTPHRLDDVDVEIAAQMITGKADCHLPIVYVSAGFHNDHNVDCDRLADDLLGMAHVVVEPNRNFSLRLKIDVDSENVYGGTIGVYWPDAAGRRSFFVGSHLKSPEEVRGAVVDEVTQALANRRALKRCTWSYVQEATSRQRIAELRESGSRELDEYIQTFDNELTAKEQELNSAEREIQRLQSEVSLRREESRRSSARGLLQGGDERNLYSQEIYGIVRTALEEARASAEDDSRRKHVLSAILEANPLDGNPAKSMGEEIKSILKGKRGLNDRTIADLEKMGFKVTEGGKHYKLVFRGDDRYTFSFPKSSSDWRGGMNAVRDIRHRLF